MYSFSKYVQIFVCKSIKKHALDLVSEYDKLNLVETKAKVFDRKLVNLDRLGDNFIVRKSQAETSRGMFY